jgi:hypothetical protein
VVWPVFSLRQPASRGREKAIFLPQASFAWLSASNRELYQP